MSSRGPCGRWAMVRIVAQLVDAVSGSDIFAERYDGTVDDLLGLQDRIAEEIAGILEPALQQAEIERVDGNHLKACRHTTTICVRWPYPTSSLDRPSARCAREHFRRGNAMSATILIVALHAWRSTGRPTATWRSNAATWLALWYSIRTKRRRSEWIQS